MKFQAWRFTRPTQTELTKQWKSTNLIELKQYYYRIWSYTARPIEQVLQATLSFNI